MVYPRQIRLCTDGNGVLSGSTIVLAPSPTQSFNPNGVSEGQRWDERGNAIGWSDGYSLEATKHAVQPTVYEGQVPLDHGGDSVDRNHRGGVFERPTGLRVQGREVLATPSDPRQHLRTRSLSGFHRDTTR